MKIKSYTTSLIYTLLLAMLLSGCSFYAPSPGKVVVEVQSDEAYYAGFFRACEILINQQVEGVYIQIDSRLNDTDLKPKEQCLHIVQQMMDLNAARHYSRNWPGMQSLLFSTVPESQKEPLAPLH